jgi:hypothetical protein
VIVVNQSNGTGIVSEIPADSAGNVSEGGVFPTIKEGIVCFSSRKRFVFVEETIEGLPTLTVGL